MKSNKKRDFLDGLNVGFPVILGFIPVGIAYAISARTAGLSIFQTCLMSLTVFAGASQMMAVEMIMKNASLIAIVIATLIINLRHIIMSMCVFNKMDDNKNKFKYLASFGITDESFALFTTSKKEKNTLFFLFGLITVGYVSWNIGTLIGALSVDFLPDIVIASLGISLYAMFIGLLVPNFHGNYKLGLLALFTALCNWLLGTFLESSWALIASTILCALLGVFVVDLKEEENA